MKHSDTSHILITNHIETTQKPHFFFFFFWGGWGGEKTRLVFLSFGHQPNRLPDSLKASDDLERALSQFIRDEFSEAKGRGLLSSSVFFGLLLLGRFFFFFVKWFSFSLGKSSAVVFLGKGMFFFGLKWFLYVSFFGSHMDLVWFAKCFSLGFSFFRGTLSWGLCRWQLLEF